MDKDTVFQQVKNLLLFKAYPPQIKLSSYLKDNLYMDNLDYAILRTEILQKYNISFNMDECLKWTTVDDVVRAISDKL